MPSIITLDDLHRLIAAMGAQAQEDIEWAESICPPATPESFALEAIFVICNSGMKNTVARRIFERVCSALHDRRPVVEVFKHLGKVAAIESIWSKKERLHQQWVALNGQPLKQLEFCAGLPWIGGITKYHLAKNFGADVAKADVHLQRLADREGCTAQQLCARLARASGLRIATVDTLLWRACANGLIDSRTGQLAAVHGSSHN